MPKVVQEKFQVTFPDYHSKAEDEHGWLTDGQARVKKMMPGREGLPGGDTDSRFSANTALFNSLPPGIPANSGAFRRITLKLRENCIVGIPRFPASCSVATTNMGDRLVVTTQKAIADAWPGYGVAEGPTGLGPEIGRAHV